MEVNTGLLRVASTSMTMNAMDQVDVVAKKQSAQVDDVRLFQVQIRNKSDEYVETTFVIHFHLNGEIPIAFYAPSSQSIILSDTEEYSVIGGVSKHSITYSCHTEEWSLLSQHGEGCMMEFEVKLSPFEKQNVYYFEARAKSLNQLESLHYHTKLSCEQSL
ncbi:hypothetical protein FLK61_29755 [Paenalkalicoccus suaedae]|uniref:Uncharacterized protein n=1 Tax=Paenalkalicoccus suaedae TaxID=2592382 RepID=A0A859FDK0_9BACI|nr:hypothetical protein [Paenalkalicoccus suaedae]QKS70911.1 hypothetical protein FLK61_29755 [Paenalkalicoccus suaedae]